MPTQETKYRIHCNADDPLMGDVYNFYITAKNEEELKSYLNRILKTPEEFLEKWDGEYLYTNLRLVKVEKIITTVEEFDWTCLLEEHIVKPQQ